MSFEPTEIPETYPIIKGDFDETKFSGIIVLFTEEGAGFCLEDSVIPSRVGDYRKDWWENAFRPISGKLTLNIENGKIVE